MPPGGWILRVPSPAFCWLTWAILGQASGAYVGPTCWAVLFLAAAGCVLHQRSAESQRDSRPMPPPYPLAAMAGGVTDPDRARADIGARPAITSVSLDGP